MAVEGHAGQSSYLYLVILNLFTFGVELCTSASFSYLPPLLLETGFSETMMSITLALGPLCALLVLPFIGTASDRCTSRYGRRRPYILAMMVCLAVSLALLPNGMAIGMSLDYVLPGRLTGLVIIAISVILLDFGSQISLLPVESLMLDQCKTEVHLNRAYSVFNFMLSIGSCFGYLVLCIDWNKTYLFEALGGMDHMLFTILLFLLLLSALPTLIFAKDPPITTHDIQKNSPVNDRSSHTFQTVPHLQVNGKSATPAPNNLAIELPHQDQVHSGATIRSGSPPSVSIQMQTVFPPTIPPLITRKYHLLRIVFQMISIPASCIFGCFYVLMPDYYKICLMDAVRSVRTMPTVLRKLCVVNLLTCMAVMGFRLYFTDYVGEALYHGNPDSPLDSPSRQMYENGIRMASLGLLFQSLTSAMFSFMLNHFILSYGTIFTYIFGMLSFTIMTGLMLVVEDVTITLLLAAFTGFACATINSLPFTLLSLYHQNQERYYSDVELKDSRLHGIGSDIALIDSAYVLSEVLSSFLFGIAVEVTGTTLAYMFCCCLCGLFGCYYILQLKC